MAKLFKPQKKRSKDPLLHEASIIQKIRLSHSVFQKRKVLILYIFLSLFLLIMGTLNLPVMINIQGFLMDRLSPVLKGTSQPILVLKEWKDWILDFFNAPTKIQNLRNENLSLKNKLAEAQSLLEENRDLKKLVNIKNASIRPFLTARVLSYPSHPYFQSIIIDAGKNNGVEVDQVALTDQGLVGRVIQVGSHTAQVVLISDSNSRIPVMIGNKKILAILAGNNQGLPLLKYVPEKSDIAVGDRVVTSGKGGIFRAGIPVGSVTHIKEGTISVAPFVGLDQISFVSLLQKFLGVY